MDAPFQRKRPVHHAATQHFNRTDPYPAFTQSHLIRQALYEWMLENWEDAPEEVKEKVDREWLEDQVEGEVGVEA
jgi:hypothetical protein